MRPDFFPDRLHDTFNNKSDISSIVSTSNIRSFFPKPDPDDTLSIVETIRHYLISPDYYQKILTKQYYEGDHDILYKKRTMVTHDKQIRVANVPNNKIVDNEFQRLANQKASYLSSNPLVVDHKRKPGRPKNNHNNHSEVHHNANLKTDPEQILSYIILNVVLYGEVVYHKPTETVLNPVLTIPVKKSPYEISKDFIYIEPVVSIRSGVYYLHYVIHLSYSPLKYMTVQDKFEKNTIDIYPIHSSIYFQNVVLIQQTLEQYFTQKNKNNNKNTLNYHSSNREHFKTPEEREVMSEYSEDVPLYNLSSDNFIYFDNINPLLPRVKGLQDSLNELQSSMLNLTQEDPRNTVLVLNNYSGTDLNEFRNNLAQYGIIKVDSRENVQGGVEALRIEVNPENYQMVINLIKKALIKNAGGYDLDDLKAGVTPNQMTIKAIFNDIELESNLLEIRLKTSLRKLASHLYDYAPEDILRVGFNKTSVVIESQQIIDIMNLKGILSEISLIKRVPGVDNPEQEYELLQEDKLRAKKLEEPVQQTPSTTINQSERGTSESMKKPVSQSDVYNKSDTLLH